MSTWGIAASVYGTAMALAALVLPIPRRPVALAAAVAYALLAAGLATFSSSLWVNLLAPGGLLLGGYWLSGLLFHTPQPWLERWLLVTDRAIGADRWMEHLPRPLVELLELSYAADYVVIGGGAIFTATFGVEAVSYYWTLVLTAELASFVFLPWFRSRPPRVLEAAEVVAGVHLWAALNRNAGSNPRLSYFRRMNVAILDRASVQANTLPSGHVSGAAAAALGAMAVNPAVGWTLLVVAGLIAVAAVAGRYHYAVDCAAGAIVSVGVWLAM